MGLITCLELVYWDLSRGNVLTDVLHLRKCVAATSQRSCTNSST